MTGANRGEHWEGVYRTKGEREVSWFQETPSVSLELIRSAGATRLSPIVDIGGGASRLVDALVDRGYEAVTVLDLSESALAAAKGRLGQAAAGVTWIVADVVGWRPRQSYDIWHDRAAFHFLTDAADQTAYVACLREALRPGGHAIIATFAPDGPERCSGLPVVRYDATSLGEVLGDAFSLVETRRHDHRTPMGSTQRFQFSLFRRD
ncbi:MAG TPA: class I SAM-dependent methyltransferase [Xanthobacteraceae bacterium]|jgi:SAM-dependent methyltransferase|nr:class I SAM-dependent methyltransferase [Xanthobacteraceae bacterium]